MTQYIPQKIKDVEAWKKTKLSNTDAYSSCAIEASAHTMCLLDEGKTPEKACEVGFANKCLTGYLASCAAGIVSHVHERGEEFRIYWNDKYGVKSDKGCVNIAMLTVK